MSEPSLDLGLDRSDTVPDCLRVPVHLRSPFPISALSIIFNMAACDSKHRAINQAMPEFDLFDSSYLVLLPNYALLSSYHNEVPSPPRCPLGNRFGTPSWRKRSYPLSRSTVPPNRRHQPHRRRPRQSQVQQQLGRCRAREPTTKHAFQRRLSHLCRPAAVLGVQDRLACRVRMGRHRRRHIQQIHPPNRHRLRRGERSDEIRCLVRVVPRLRV